MRSNLFLGCAVAIIAVIVVGRQTNRVDASVGPIPLNHLNSAWPGSLSGS